MKFTLGWLKEHLDTKYKDNKIIEKLTDIGLEVESFENVGSELISPSGDVIGFNALGDALRDAIDPYATTTKK